MVAPLRVLLVGALIACSVAACGEEPPPAGVDTALEDRVAVSHAGLAVWATALLAETGVEVLPLFEEGSDPATTLPSRERLAAARAARLVALNGASYEQWAGQVALPPSRVVRTADVLPAERLIEVEGVTHAHGAGGEHSHKGTHPITWLDPELMWMQIARLEKALRQAFPAHADAIAANAAALRDAHAEPVSPAPELDGVVLIASHPSWDYLARALGAELRQVDLEPDALPTRGDRNRLRAARPTGMEAIVLWEAFPTEGMREHLRERLDMESVVLPLGDRWPFAMSIGDREWSDDQRVVLWFAEREAARATLQEAAELLRARAESQ